MSINFKDNEYVAVCIQVPQQNSRSFLFGSCPAFVYAQEDGISSLIYLYDSSCAEYRLSCMRITCSDQEPLQLTVTHANQFEAKHINQGQLGFLRLTYMQPAMRLHTFLF